MSRLAKGIRALSVCALSTFWAGGAQAVTLELLGSTTAFENAGNLDLTVRLSATAAETISGGTCDLSIDMFLESVAPQGVATAVPGEDYVDTTAFFSLSLPQDSATDVSTQEVFSIPLINDSRVEPLIEGVAVFGDVLTGECFNQVPNGLVADLGIGDDDPLTFTFDNQVEVDEGVGTVSAGITLTNISDAPADFIADISVGTVDGSATAGSDYDAVSDTLSFNPNLVQSALSVDIIDDTEVEPLEAFAVGFNSGSAIDGNGFEIGVLVTNGFAIGITDNDVAAGPVLGFQDVDVQVLESAGVAQLQVTPSTPPVADVTVDFASFDASATSPDDYTSVSGTLTFPAGSLAAQTINVAIINDADNEGGEAFDVELTNPGGGATIDPNTSVASVFISDNDTNNSSDITFSGAPGETFTFNYSVEDDTPSRNTQQQFSSVSTAGNGPFTVTYTATIPATATPGDSFQDAVEYPIDSPPSIDVFFTLNVTQSAAPPEYSFAASAASVDENGGSVSLQVQRTGDLTNSGSVDYQTIAGTALAGEDFQAIQDTVTFGPGEAGPVTVDVVILDDTDVEGDEAFDVELINPLDGTVSASAGLATVTITDDDSPPPPPPPAGSLQFTVTEVTVDESVGTVDIEVSREGGSAGAASVAFETIEDTAIAGEDFTAISDTLTWADGDVDPRTISIEVLVDTDMEGLEEFSVALSAPVGATLGTPAAVTVTITDLGRDIAGIPGLSANQRDMAGWFDSNCDRLIGSNPTDVNQQDLASVCANLRSTNTTDQQVRDGLDAVNAEELATVATTTLRLLGDQHGNLQRRINGLRSGATGIDLSGLDVNVNDQRISGAVMAEMIHGLTWGAVGEESDFGRWGFFVDGKIDFGERDDNAANNGYDLDSTLITIGADYRVRDNFFIGGAIGYADADVDFNGGGGLDFDSWRGSIYTTNFASERYYVDALISYGTTDYDSARRIFYTDSGGTVDRTATGSTDGNLFTAGFGSGFDFNKGGFTFGPNFGAYYFDVDVDAYSEAGAGGLNLNIGDQNAKSFTMNAGGHASWVINTKWGVLIPNARFDLVHEFEDGVEQVGVRFAADPFTNDPTSPSTPIMVRSERPDENYFVWSVGASAQFVRGFSGFVTYQSTEGYSNLELNEVSLGMRYEKTF